MTDQQAIVAAANAALRATGRDEFTRSEWEAALAAQRRQPSPRAVS